ncbi:hypothetical protein [Streptomyces sp. NPDC056401]|uniref:hypothetical protein n=1 Tax=Streptomyces sp. NPDC056401 TaxID=3345809 RepID=UPI0035E21259
MKIKAKRAIATGLSTLAVLAGGVVGASSASATTKCYDRDGGQLCVEYINNGYNASFYNLSGQAKHVDFNLICIHPEKRFGDNGSFWSNPGTRSTYFFAVGSWGQCYVAMYDYGTGQWYNSPRS